MFHETRVIFMGTLVKFKKKGLQYLLSISKEGHKLVVSKYKVLRRIFKPNREELTGQLRNMHKQWMHNLY